MTTTTETPATDSSRADRLPKRHYLNAGYTVRSWLLTSDHKRIAILYLLSITFFFVIGGLAATVVRLDLMTPSADLVQTETFNKLFTAHGVIMVFFFLIPSIPAVLGNFQVLNVMSSAGASILGVGYLFPLTYLLWSLCYGKFAASNPWRATGLEWQTESPPPTENFAETPVVVDEAYDYERLDSPMGEGGSP